MDEREGEITGTEKIGICAAEMLDSAFDADLEDVRNAEIGAVMVIAEVTFEDSNPDEPGYTHVFYRCSDGRRWVQRGLLRETIDATYR